MIIAEFGRSICPYILISDDWEILSNPAIIQILLVSTEQPISPEFYPAFEKSFEPYTIELLILVIILLYKLNKLYKEKFSFLWTKYLINWLF